jgi:microtubule-associated protein-like 6
MTDFFLHSKELTLREFQTIAKEDPDIRQAMETLGIFQIGKFSDDYIQGLEEELHRSEGNHSEIDPEKYKKIREGVDFKQKPSGLFEEQETEGGDQFMAVKPYLGTVLNSAPSNSKEFKGNLDPPEMDMKLKYVHGYRAFDTRNNIYFVDDRHFMFHAAGVNIKMCTEMSRNKTSSEASFKQYFNIENSDDITAMAFNWKTKLAAFGQVGHKPLINIVNSMNMETEAVLVGHLKKGIGHLAIDQNGEFLVGTAMNDDHDIVIYDISSLQRNDNRGQKKCRLVCKSKGVKDKVLALRFSKIQGDRTIFMGTRRDLYYIQWSEKKLTLKKVSGYAKDKKQGNICIGHLNGFDCVVGTKTGELQGIKGMSPAKYAKGHSRIVYAMCSSKDGNTLISGGADGKIIIWGGKLQQLSSFAINENFRLVNPRIRAISLSNSNKSLIVGTRGGQIVKIDFGSTKMRNCLVKEIILDSHHSDELWGLACHSTRPEFVTCGEDFLLAKWNLNNKKQIKNVTLKYQAKVVAIHEKRNHLAVGCKNGRVIMLDYETLQTVKEIKVCTKEISEMKFSPVCLENGSRNGKELLAVGAHDGKIYIYDASMKYKRLAILRGHHSTITHIDFGLDGSFLQSNCTSYELLYYSLDTYKQNTRGASQLKDEAWGTWTCTFGWWVQGIYPPCSDGTDVNSVDRSSCGKYLITGDDFGTVKIFNNPALKKAAYKKYLGHSSHVTNVRFALNDQYIISVGK